MSNEKQALRKYFRQFGGKEVQVAVEACGFWPAFREVVEGEVERLVLVPCSPAAKRYYERLLRKKHKHVARVVRVVRARKLLIAVYALLHDGVVFDGEKFAAV